MIISRAAFYKQECLCFVSTHNNKLAISLHILECQTIQLHFWCIFPILSHFKDKFCNTLAMILCFTHVYELQYCPILACSPTLSNKMNILINQAAEYRVRSC